MPFSGDCGQHLISQIRLWITVEHLCWIFQESNIQFDNKDVPLQDSTCCLLVYGPKDLKSYQSCGSLAHTVCMSTILSNNLFTGLDNSNTFNRCHQKVYK